MAGLTLDTCVLVAAGRRRLDLTPVISGQDVFVPAAERLRTWAVESHPDQDVAPADLLVAAANHLRWAGDGALGALREAVAAEGDAPPHTRCYLHGELLEAGLREEADELAREVRCSRPTDSGVHVIIGEGYEAADDLDTEAAAELGHHRLGDDPEEG